MVGAHALGDATTHRVGPDFWPTSPASTKDFRSKYWGNWHNLRQPRGIYVKVALGCDPERGLVRRDLVEGDEAVERTAEDVGVHVVLPYPRALSLDARCATTGKLNGPAKFTAART